jgi:hypothetical protein
MAGRIHAASDPWYTQKQWTDHGERIQAAKEAAPKRVDMSTESTEQKVVVDSRVDRKAYQREWLRRKRTEKAKAG